MPVLLLLAGKDEVIDNGRVRAYVEKLPAASKEIIEYPEAHHTLEFEGMDHPWLGDLDTLAERVISRAVGKSSQSAFDSLNFTRQQ